jgi:hypothetical protein
MTDNEKQIKNIFLDVFEEKGLIAVSFKENLKESIDLQQLLDKFMYELFSKYVFTECAIEDYCIKYDINLYDKIVDVLKNININVINDLKDDNNETCKLTNICKYKL